MPRWAHPPFTLLTLLPAVLLCLAAGAHAQQGSVATDKAALQALYDATNGANWTDNTNWTSDMALSTWHGVTTDGDGRVTRLELDDNGLRGMLPAALGDLSELKRLNLEDNALRGSLPSELASLTNLTSLRLTRSRALTGPLPDGLRELTDLTTVRIQHTELCAPDNDDFQTWWGTLSSKSGLICPPTEQSVIEVAVFYTPAARSQENGTAGIKAKIDLMVAATNTAYTHSAVNQRIKAVAVEEVAYTEVDSETDLTRLHDPGDGYMDEVHDIRDRFGADIVMLIRRGILGEVSRSYLMTQVSLDHASFAFGVVASAGGARHFAHELGHIMGLNHDRFVSCESGSCEAAAFPYAYGYVNQPGLRPGAPASKRWFTIMAYNDQCKLVACQGLMRFSDPEQTYQDDPLGIAGLAPSNSWMNGPSDAVRALNRARGYVANFRQPPPDITVSFGAEEYEATEDGTVANVTLELSAAPTRPIDIPLTLTATGATAYDYTGVPATVDFDADDTEQTFTVRARDDAADDDGETVTLTLGEPLPAGVTGGSPSETTVTLTDNDPDPGVPSILTVELTSDPGSDDLYTIDDKIEVSVRFSKTVTVTGEPQLTLTMGTETQDATYRDSAGEVVRFVYTVAEGDSAADGVSIATDSLSDDGTIRDSDNRDAVRTHDEVAADANHGVDGTRPVLQSAEVNLTELTLTYDKALDETSVPSTTAFRVRVGGATFSVTSVAVRGEKVTLTLSRSVQYGEDALVSYTAGSGLRDLLGNSVASLSDHPVTNIAVEYNSDSDRDGLLAITNVVQLDAMRYDLDGDGTPSPSGKKAYNAAFPDFDSPVRCVLARCTGYELSADLDFDTNRNGMADTGDTYWNNGAGWNPIGHSSTDGFEATFEGNGHKIANLFINRTVVNNSALTKNALFAGTQPSSTIRNVGLVNVDVTVTASGAGTRRAHSASALVGTNRGTIRACYATGRAEGLAAGGLVANNLGTIRASYAAVRVRSGDDNSAGGLATANSGTIRDSYATGPVGSDGSSSGLATVNTRTIRDSYATGLVWGGDDPLPPSGGLVGANYGSGTITTSFWDTSTSGQTTIAGGASGQTTTALQAPTGATGIYSTWDTDQWDFGTASQYPVLKADFDGDGTETWQEFGYQLRAGPTLTARAGVGQVVLEWTAVDAGHWSPAPAVTYTLYRDHGATVEAMAENLSGLGYTDTDVTGGETYTYQVAAVVTGGEAARSALKAIEPALPNMWLNPPESDPVAPVRSAATYSVTFQGTWTTTVTSGGIPSGAHFTTLIGGVHNAEVTFLREGGMAGAGVELVAELGGTSTLASEVQAAQPNALSVLQGSGGNIDATGSSTIGTVTLTTDHPRVTLLSMVAPSPDWFVGVSGLSLLDGQGDWLASRVLNLYPWDAGTEEGAEFSLSNSPTSPQGAITSLRGMGKFSNAPIATLTFTRQSINTAPSITSATSFEVDENRTVVAALQATDNDTASHQLTWSIPSGDGGGVDADHFALGSTGVLAFRTAKDYENPDDAGADRTYEVTVQVSDGANPVESDLMVRLLDVDDAAPMFLSATVNGTTLTLTYDEPLDGRSTPASGDFTVAGGDRARTVTRVAVRGAAVELTLDAAAEHLEAGIRVSYTPGTNPIRDAAGNDAEALSRVLVTNETPDTTPPAVSSLAISSNPGADRTYAAEDEIEVRVRFRETVEVEGTPQLRLRVGSRTRTAGYLRGADTAALVFAYEVADGDEDTDGVSIEVGRIALNGGSIEDEAENAAELAHGALAPQAGHQVDGVRPAFVSAAVDGAALTLTYGEALDGGSRPAAVDFTVEVDGSGRSVAGVSVSGSEVTLFLNPAVEHGDTGIRVSYAVPTGVGANPIRDAVGNEARGLSNRSVTNTTGAPNTAPEITSPGSFDVPENQALARRLQARDTDAGDEVTGWAIVGGADRFQFSIAPDTGELSFREAPDYEAPGDNQYLVTVEVTSGAGARELEAEQTFTIRVTDEREPPEVPEPPTFSGETAESLTVSWSEPDNTGPAISDYDVQYRKEGAGGFTGAPHQGSGRTLTLEDLEPGTLYQVQVRATNEEGTSGWSVSGEGMTVTPLTLVMASGADPPVSGPFTVRFSFSEPVTGFTGSDIETGQEPACRDSANNTVSCNPSFAALQTTDDRVFTATVTPQTDRVAHSYTLTLTVPAGAVRSLVGSKPNEEPEEPLEVRVSPPGSPEPISSIALGASPGSGSVRLSWNRPSDNGGSRIVRYEYRYAATGEAWSQWENVGAGARGVMVGNLVNGREYVFEVRAVNSLGKGGAETAMAVPELRIAPPRPPPAPRPPGNGDGGGLLFPPEAPAGLTALPGEGAVRLEWGPPASDGGTPILRYEYRLKEGLGEFGEWTPIEDSGAGEVNAAGYTVGELGKGTVYVFELRAVNLVGNGRVSEAVEVVMGLDRAYWSNLGAEDLEGGEASLEHTPFGGTPQRLRLRFGADLRFEESELDGDGEVTETRPGSYGYRYTSRTTGELSLDYDGGDSCELRMTFRGVGAGSYSYRCGGALRGQGSFRLSGLNRAPEITSAGAYEVAENQARVGQLQAVDPDEGDGITGYGIAGGADAELFAIVEETGELRFREVPDYENPGDVESSDPESGAGDNEYVVVVEVRSGEGERERKGSRAIRVRVTDEEEPPEITGAGVFEVVENRTVVGRLEAVDSDEGDEIEGYGIAGGADASLFVIEAETGELSFREAPDYEDPGDVASAEPPSPAGDNEYIVVVEVWSGEGERERKGSRAIRVRVTDEQEPPEITSVGPFEVVENRTMVGQLEAVDPDKQDEIRGYGITGGADGVLFAVDEETGKLMFREAPDYESPSDVESAEPQSGAADNEYIVVVEVSSGERERERKGSRAIRVGVSDEEEPPGAPAAPAVTAEGSDSLKVSWTEPENHGPEITDYEVRYREAGEAGYSDGGRQGTGLTVRLSGLKEGTAYEVQVRAVNEEGMSEWSEPGEGRTDREEADPEEPDPDDPSDFTGEELEGRRLTLRLEGEEGTAGSLELRFGEGNRFEQIESGGEQAATRAEGTARSGSYTYEKTGPRMGTVRLAYDDGASCEIRLSFTESGVGAFAYDCGGGDAEEGSFRLTTGSLFVPVILSAAGRSNSFFTSELTLTNRGEREARLDYSYTAHIGGGSGRASEVLAPGIQKIETDALTYLRGLGIAIPETGNRIGTLRVEARLGSEVEAVVRTTTLVPEGRAGLAYLGVAEEEGFDEAVYLCGLRQNSRDRSNVAFQNMGAPEEGAITLRTTVYSGEAADATARILEDVRLEPGGFHQYSGLLGVLGVPAQGYVKVERVEGTSPFYAYGVINDQANSDGSFVFPVAASWLEGRMGQTLPVIVETSAFRSELTVTNFSEEPRTLDFRFVADAIKTTDKTAGFSMKLEAGEQRIIPEVVEELRRQEVAGLGSTRGFYAGAVFATAEEGNMSGIVIGARTGSEGSGGSYSVFYNAAPFGSAFTEVAWVEGLQQNRENRSNLALVNTGEVDESASVFHLEIYDGETGLLAETVVTKPIPARRWHQINGILGSYAPETRQGYIRIEKVSGENPFLAYGVVNDGGAPGERSGDGAYLPARE